MRKFFKKHWRFSWRNFFILLFSSLLSLFLIIGFLILFSLQYNNLVFPGLYLGEYYIGQMSENELVEYLQKINNRLIDEGLLFSFDLGSGEQDFVIYPTIISEDNYVELFKFWHEEEAKRLLKYGKENNIFLNAFNFYRLKFQKPHLSIKEYYLNRNKLVELINSSISKYEKPVTNANLIIKSTEPLEYVITSSTIGYYFDAFDLDKQVINEFLNLRRPRIHLNLSLKEPDITEKDIKDNIDKVKKILEAGNIELKYIDSNTKKEYSWLIKKDQIANWLTVSLDENKKIIFVLDYNKVINYLEVNICSEIEREPINAKFKLGDNNKVEEFQSSRPGLKVEKDKVFNDLNNIIKQRIWHNEGLSNLVVLSVQQVEPEIKTGEVNDLGIKEILGVGYSYFYGSPYNRIKNIKHAVFDKLNGLLIKPDEEFSLINALKPFTVADGYLMELVIKGDRIVPAIGGGLCQVATTMFRTAMNSGLPITQRVNHSLWVPYYNDDVNGNPGTDATIYDPYPDLKFINDTGHYILITTEMDLIHSKLSFTFWGTSDGRKGYFSHPVVHAYYPYGPETIIETTDLAPGQKECQPAHKGASASFVYTVEFPNGEKKEQIFKSYYRPLPRICLIGKQK